MTGPSAPSRRLVLLALLGWAALGGAWSFASPLASVPDEGAHAVRAVSLVRGEVVGERTSSVEPGPPEVRATLHRVTVPAGYTGITDRHTCYTPARGPADCTEPLLARPGTARWTTTAGAYHPPFHAWVGMPSLALDPTAAMHAGRLLSVAVGAVLLAIATRAAVAVAGRWGLLGIGVAVTPMTPYLVGSLNPSGVEVTAAIATWATSVELVRAPSRAAAWRWAGVAAVLAWARPFSALLVAGIASVVLLFLADRAGVRRLWHQPVGAAVLFVGLAVAGSLLWIVAAGTANTFIAVPDPTLAGAAGVRASLELTWVRLEEMVGVFGWLDTRLPNEVPLAWGTATLALLAAGLVRTTWRRRAVLAALAVGAVLLPTLAEAGTAAEMGLAWQGRYTLPVAVGVPLLAAVSISDALARRPSTASALPRSVLTAATGLLGAVHVLAVGHVLSRFSIGPGARPWGFLDPTGWSPAIPDLAIVGLAAMGVALLTSTALVAGDASDVDT